MLGRFEWSFGGEEVVDGHEDGLRMYKMPTSQASLAHDIKASTQLNDVQCKQIPAPYCILIPESKG